jgi:hypothetical protein
MEQNRRGPNDQHVQRRVPRRGHFDLRGADVAQQIHFTAQPDQKVQRRLGAPGLDPDAQERSLLPGPLGQRRWADSKFPRPPSARTLSRVSGGCVVRGAAVPGVRRGDRRRQGRERPKRPGGRPETSARALGPPQIAGAAPQQKHGGSLEGPYGRSQVQVAAQGDAVRFVAGAQRSHIYFLPRRRIEKVG